MNNIGFYEAQPKIINIIQDWTTFEYNNVVCVMVRGGVWWCVLVRGGAWFCVLVRGGDERQ